MILFVCRRVRHFRIAVINIVSVGKKQTRPPRAGVVLEGRRLAWVRDAILTDNDSSVRKRCRDMVGEVGVDGWDYAH